jgi:cell division protease FtsH
MGGRAAEDLFIGQVCTGALNDLERATKIAYSLVVYYGMSDKIANISYYDSNGQNYGFTKPYSEERARLIDEEVSRILNEQYDRAKEILTQYKEGHARLAQLLIEREVIFTADVEEIFGKRKWISRAEEIAALNQAKEEKKKADLANNSDNADNSAESDPSDSAQPTDNTDADADNQSKPRTTPPPYIPEN